MSELKINRRAMLIASGAAMLAAATGTSSLTAAAESSGTRKAFPKAFRWGASTAAYQVEGNNINSDLWLLEDVEPKTFQDRSGDACDSYHRFDEDVALLKQIGLNAYRFSIEWARIEPTRGRFSNAEIDYYKRNIAALRKAGIDPVVTFHHVSAPRWFAEAGGWLNPDSSDLFARYCEKLARELGDGIAYVCTINEPQVGLTYRVVPGAETYFKAQDELQIRAHIEAARRAGVERFITMNHADVKGMQPQLMSAHEKGFAAIKAARPKLPTGVTLNLVDFAPANEGSKYKELCELAYGPWMDVVKRAGDFVGVQTYRQVLVPGVGAALPPLAEMPFVKPDQRQEIIKQPIALKNMVEYANERTGLPVFVTENGLETENDERRAWYIPQVLSHLQDAIAAGVPVIGYCHWSLLDNFEWLQGYKPKFGLASVDPETFRRTLKPSAKIYSQIVKRNSV